MAILLALAALFAALGYFVGRTKGRPDEGAVLGLVLGPLGLLIILLVEDKRPRCPHCREAIAPGAEICPHCQQRLAPAPNVTCICCKVGFRVTGAALGHPVRCPHCGRITPTKRPEPATHAGTAEVHQ